MKNPSIRKHLLWEYDWAKIDFSQLTTVTIERVVERGTINEWKEIIRYYGKDKISSIVKNSTRLDNKTKNFTPIFLQSDFVN